MKIMSFNTQHCLNFIEQRVDYDIMAKAINDLGADVVGLQEMFSEGEGAVFGNQTKILAEKAGFKYYYFAKAIDDASGPYGNAIISKIPIVSAETIIIPDPFPKRAGGWYETRCVLRAVLENGLTVLVTHFGLEPDEQENAQKAVLSLIEDKNCVLLGDFNIRPDNALLEPIRAKMRDTAELFSAPHLSFPSNAPTMKIDYVFTSRDLALLSADIPDIVASDHRPYIIEIE